MENAMPRYDCNECGTRIHDDEVEAARDAAEYCDELLCESCLCERDHFTCSACRECGEKSDQHAYVVVRDAEAAGVRLPGLYRVTQLPYYTQGLIGGGWLLPRAVTWLGFLETVDTDDFPCGHLCAICQQRILADLETHTLQTAWAAQR
jgi:hypothetical protein